MPCATLARWVGRSTNTTADHFSRGPNHFSDRLILDCTSPGARLRFGRPCCRGTDLAECVSVPGEFLRPQGAFPPGFYSLREGWVNRPAPEAPLIWEMPGACGLRPCARTHHKKGLVPHLPVGWGGQQTPRLTTSGFGIEVRWYFQYSSTSMSYT